VILNRVLLQAYQADCQGTLTYWSVLNRWGWRPYWLHSKRCNLQLGSEIPTGYTAGTAAAAATNAADANIAELFTATSRHGKRLLTGGISEQPASSLAITTLKRDDPINE
jgi:hypothetical protein